MNPIVHFIVKSLLSIIVLLPIGIFIYMLLVRQKKEWINSLITCLLVVLFLYTGGMKFFDHPLFLYTTKHSPWQLLSENAGWITWAIPFLEVAIAALLIIPQTNLIGLYGASLLMAAFSIYVVVLLKSGLHLPCSCGGVIQYMNWTEHAFFNASFVLLSVLAIINERNTWSNSGIGKNQVQRFA